MLVIDSTSSSGQLAPTDHDAVLLDKVDIIDQSSSVIASTLDTLNSAFQEVNLSIHSHPELAYQEAFAHDKLTDFLEHHGFQVKRHAWGLETAFEATFGSGGRQVVFCAEYDALPGIGHGCGHNLIATSSLAAFVSAARALQTTKLPGRLRIIGTPAEEGGGGKIKLLEAGAFDPPQDIAAALMSHPMTSGPSSDGLMYDGIAGTKSIAAYKTKVIFKGRASHAGAEPWNGINALDAAVGAYVNVSMLRQQIRPDERVHGVFEDGGTVPNIIPQYTRMNWCIRSPTLARCQNLVNRVKACFEAGAAAANCRVEYETAPLYNDLLVNNTLSNTYVEDMAKLGLNIKPEENVPASTDMGNVSYHVPGFHGGFAIPTTPDVSIHHPDFATCAGKKGAHKAAMNCARGLAMTAIRVLADEELSQRVRNDFERAV
ncbi:amidohydrolase [Fusarium denticulatum]|uniref:Peptidase M20 domain-containing protein 2 n=1 Tax=Fusarium denticulatum TaxID=48507 RepID=A0A8H5X4T8_9HYPO|nr:amidohydrolase [Fusarium denticulatum]